MPSYDIDPTEVDAIGLVLRQDQSGRTIDELEPNELKAYGVTLRRHLYSFHGLDTSRMENKADPKELEFIHYKLHQVERFMGQPHTHRHIDYVGDDMRLQWNGDSTQDLADEVVRSVRITRG